LGDREIYRYLAFTIISIPSVRDLPFYVIEEGTIHGTVMFLESPLNAATWALNSFAGYSKCK
jgi:hypothetical protein